MKSAKKLNCGALHIANNFNLFGFGSPSSALVQCVKELVENSIDACREVVEDVSPVISVLMANLAGKSDVVMIHVTDEGVGMKDTKRLLQCFETTKVDQENGANTTGRFGVGLSTCLIYSLISCDYPVRIITKTAEDEMCSISDFVLDKFGNPVAMSITEQSVSMISGTRISIPLPIVEETSISQVIEAITQLFQRFSLLPTTFINVKFNVEIEGFNSCPSFHHHSEYVSWSPFAALSILQSPTLDNYRANLLSRYLSMVDKDAECSAEISTVRIPIDFGLTSQASFVVASVIVVKQSPVDSGALDRSNNNNNSSTSSSDGMPVSVYRYANGVPLPDWQQDAQSCALSAALRAVRWHLYGLSLSLSLLRESQPIDEVTAVGCCDENEKMLLVPNWILSSANSDGRSAALSLFRMTVVCDIQAKHVPFANMRKTCISSDCKPVVTAVVKAVSECVKELQQRDLTRQLFMSRRDSEQMRIVTTYIPSVVSSVVKILCLPEDKSELASLMDKLMIEENGTASEQRHALEAKLVQLLRSLYEENNRNTNNYNSGKRQKLSL